MLISTKNQIWIDIDCFASNIKERFDQTYGIMLAVLTLRHAVVDPGFPREAPTYYLINFSQKLHEYEEILGRGRPLRPLDQPLSCLPI